MADKLLVVTAGLDATERAAIAEAFDWEGAALLLAPLLATDLPATVSATCQAIAEGREPAPDAEEVALEWPLAFLATLPRPAIDSFIAAFKKVVDRRGIFAALTPTNGEWTFAYLVEHLSEEHQQVLEMEAAREQ